MSFSPTFPSALVITPSPPMVFFSIRAHRGRGCRMTLLRVSERDRADGRPQDDVERKQPAHGLVDKVNGADLVQNLDPIGGPPLVVGLDADMVRRVLNRLPTFTHWIVPCRPVAFFASLQKSTPRSALFGDLVLSSMLRGSRRRDRTRPTSGGRDRWCPSAGLFPSASRE